MRRLVTTLAFAALASGCGPAAAPQPAASATPSAKPTDAPGGAPVVVATPTPAATARAASPVALKITIDGKPANIKPMAYATLVLTTNASIFYNVGAFAEKGEQNIGQGYGILAEGEGNITLHMKMAQKDGNLDWRSLSDAEYKGAVNMTYKEGPKCLTWYANGGNYSSGAFTVTGDRATFKMATEIAGSKENSGASRRFEIEISGLPRP